MSPLPQKVLQRQTAVPPQTLQRRQPHAPLPPEDIQKGSLQIAINNPTATIQQPIKGML